MKRIICAIALAWLLGLVGRAPIFAADAPKPPASDWATLALFRFDETPVADAGPLGLSVTPADLPLAEGRFGKALDCAKLPFFHIGLPHAAHPGEGFTLECWLKYLGPGEGKIQRVAGRNASYGLLFHRLRPDLTFFVKTTAGEWKSANATVEKDKWTHVAGTYDGQTLRLYLDGQLVSETENPGIVTPKGGAFAIGMEHKQEPQNRFNGLIDELRLSNVARTEFMTGEAMPKPKPTTTLKIIPFDPSKFLKTATALPASPAPKIDGFLTDAVWTKAPVDRFEKAEGGGDPAAATIFQVARDEANLYLAFNASEKGQESHRHQKGLERDAGALWKCDTIELFLQPEGPDTDIYQIALTPTGGVWDTTWRVDGREEWDAADIDVAGQIGPDNWTVEVAIPFASLGAGRPDAETMWRANFCRTENPSGELTAWNKTGGAYRAPKQFGVVKFLSAAAPAKTPAAEKAKAPAGPATCRVKGMVVDQKGEPIAHVPIKTIYGGVRTDLNGEYRIADVAPGTLGIMIESPRYKTVAGEVEVSRAREIVAPIALERVDPYAPVWGGKVGKGAVAWIASSIAEPPDMDNKPMAEARVDRLAMAATPGEYESRAVALVANAAVAKPSATLGALSGPGGAAIPAEAVDLRWTQRLLKRKQYKRMREDAQFSWRYLWREQPETIAAGHVRQLVVTVKVPEGAKPGLYKGAIDLADGGKRVASLPVELRVADFTLAKPEKFVGAYYYNRFSEPRSDKPEELVLREMRDIMEHGGSVLIFAPRLVYTKNADETVSVDSSDIRQAIEWQKKVGIGPPWLANVRPSRAAILAGLKWSREQGPEMAAQIRELPKVEEYFARGLAEIDRLEKKYGGEIVITWADEIMGHGRLEPWLEYAKIARKHSDNRIYITYHNRDQARADMVKPYVDIRCYHGHTLDSWLDAGHQWDELAADLDGDVAWNYYNIRDITVTSEYARLCNGYWLWRSALQAHVPWTYNAYGGSPFDDLDSDRHDFAYAAPHPTKPEMVSSLEWECYREGYDDLRYVTTLERAIDRAAKKNPKAPAVATGRAIVKKYWDATPQVTTQSKVLDGQDYNRRRDEMIAAIEALGEVLE